MAEEVRIISEVEITTYPVPGVPKRVKVITFVYKDLPPLDIIIPVEEYSEEKLKEAIKKRIQEYMKRPAPRVIKL